MAFFLEHNTNNIFDVSHTVANCFYLNFNDIPNGCFWAEFLKN